MMQIKSNAEKKAGDLTAMSNNLIDGIRRGCIRIQEAIMLRSTSAYLQGPRPLHLGIDSTRLIRSMEGRFMFEGQGTQGGTNYSIMKAEVRGTRVVLTYGTKAVSDKGYSYPARWEYAGDKRPFLNPAIRDTEGRFKTLMSNEIRAILNKKK